MKTIVIDDIKCELDMAQLFARLHVSEDSDYARPVRDLAAQAMAIARPRVILGEAYVDERGDDFVVVAGARFRSRVMSVNLDGVYRVFPYVATCGVELAAWAASLDDMLATWWADGIMLAALQPARTALMKRVEEEFRPGRTNTMNPGSLEDWPLEEQRPLFSLFGDVEGAIGVKLTDSCLMVPAKSVSGVIFPSETGYENCQLCPREVCPGRRAPYDKGLFERKYKKG
jgi:hypothetical protein